jgi:NitT/TauT family transport system permease protein
VASSDAFLRAPHRRRTAPAAGRPARSAAYQAYLSALRRRARAVQLWQSGLIVAALVVWEVAPRAGWINPMLTSYPSAVARTFMSMVADGSLAVHTWATVAETVAGFTGGMALGVASAMALWWSPFLHRVLDPFIVVLNALPKIALVPIFYIWLGDVASIYAMAIAVSVFVTVIMLYTGFQAIDPDKIRLVRLFGASRVQVLTKIVLPGSVPTMISTLKVNVGLALVGVVVGEFQAAKAGLGYLITYGSQIFQMNLVMTAIVMLAVISSLLFAAIQALEATVLRRHGTVGAPR